MAAAATGNAGRLLKLAAEGSQTRADVLCLLCAASLVFTGLSWKAIESRRPEPVKPQGDDCLAFQEVRQRRAKHARERLALLTGALARVYARVGLTRHCAGAASAAAEVQRGGCCCRATGASQAGLRPPRRATSFLLTHCCRCRRHRRHLLPAPFSASGRTNAQVLPAEARRELEWAWTAAAASTSCVSMAVFYNGECVMQAGARAPAGGAADERPDELAAAVRGRSIEEITGPIVLRAMEKGRGNYLANLILFPGRDEFFAYFPKNLQGVLVHPVGDNGVLVAGTDTQRGFSRLDQAWLGDIADKLDSTLS